MARVSGLVGEPTDETETAFAWTHFFVRPTTKSVTRLVGHRHETLIFLFENEYQTYFNCSMNNDNNILTNDKRYVRV
jgi:hypothetical protein